MMTDSATAIALTRTGLSSLKSIFGGNDTHRLVDNDSVVVFNERTAV